jgi:hypothetical protein
MAHERNSRLRIGWVTLFVQDGDHSVSPHGVMIWLGY